MSSLTLHELVERQARERPGAMAVVSKNQVLTYHQLQERIEQWASVLHSRGVRTGDAFGIVMRNSPEFVITFFALVRLGARAVPVNFLLKADEITFIFNDAGAVGVITQSAFLAAVLEVRKKLPSMKDIVVTGDADIPSDVLSFNHLM